MATPDPIPNSAVKHFSTDDTLTLRLGKVGRRQNYALFYLSRTNFVLAKAISAPRMPAQS